MVGEVVTMGVHGGLTVETNLDPAEQPFLGDHQIEGTPVLPGVMGIEAFAELATLPAGWHAVIEDVEFLAPCKFYRSEPRTVTITATFQPEGDQLVADCRLVGAATAGRAEPQVTTHFTGRVRLDRAPVTREASVRPPAPDGRGHYRRCDLRRLFPRARARCWNGLGGASRTGRPARERPALRPRPADDPETASPRLIELVFQTAGIWEIGRHGRFGLPEHVDRVVLHPADQPHGRVKAVPVEANDEGGFDGRVVDEDGSILVEVHGYRTVELPGGIDPERQALLAAAMA